jgi:putative colanic acid biosynthesis acetyltransferase WcaF
VRSIYIERIEFRTLWQASGEWAWNSPAPVHHGVVDLSAYSTRGFDRGAPRWKEALWRLCQGFFFQPLWHVPSAVRTSLLRAFGARIGQGVVVRAGVNISFPWRLTVGDHCWIGEEVMILSLAPVELGPNVCLSQRAFLCTGSHDRRDNFALRTAPIRIGPRSWVAAQAFIGPGVTLGEGCTVSAGSVVLRDVEPGQLVRGNPAEPVRSAQP